MNRKFKNNPIRINDIALEAGVSIATVSNALNDKGRLSKDVKKKILKIASKYSYKPNIIARTLSAKKSGIIGVLVPEIFSEYYYQVIAGMEKITKEEDYTLVLINTSGDTSEEIKQIKKLNRLLVEGLILFGGPNKNDALEEVISRIPVVLIDRELKNIKCSSVLVDNKNAQKDAVKFLNNLGHKNIGYIGFSTNTSLINVIERKNGYLEGLKANNLKYDPDNIIFNILKKSPLQLEEYYFFLNSHIFIDKFKKTPTAILCQNDYEAIVLLRVLTEKGVKIPEDVSVMGFDNIFISRFTTPPLTTTNQPKEKLGEAGMKLLLKVIESGKDERETIYLQTKIIERQSTSKV